MPNTMTNNGASAIFGIAYSAAIYGDSTRCRRGIRPNSKPSAMPSPLPIA